MSEERGPNGERIVDIDCPRGEFPRCARQQVDAASGARRMICPRSQSGRPVVTIMADGAIEYDATATCAEQPVHIDVPCKWGGFPGCLRQEQDPDGTIRLYCQQNAVLDPVATKRPDGTFDLAPWNGCGDVRHHSGHDDFDI